MFTTRIKGSSKYLFICKTCSDVGGMKYLYHLTDAFNVSSVKPVLRGDSKIEKKQKS